MEKHPPKAGRFAHFSLNEDWLAVVIAAVIILLSVLGILGPGGISIRF